MNLVTTYNVPVSSDANAHRIRLVEECFGTSGQPLCVPGMIVIVTIGWVVVTLFFRPCFGCGGHPDKSLQKEA